MSAAAGRTHYQVLGIPVDAAPSEIRRAHRQLAQVLHPDRQANASEGEQAFADRRMREVNAAWTVLSDPARRAEYDRQLRAQRTAPQQSAARSTGPVKGPASSRWVADEPEVEDVDPDEPDLPAAQFFLLRRGPVVAALIVGIALFVFSAYAGGDPGAPKQRAAPGCVRVIQDREAIQINCTEPNDGTIVAVADRLLDCPDGSRGVLINQKPPFSCVRVDVPESGIPLQPSTSTTTMMATSALPDGP